MKFDILTRSKILFWSKEASIIVLNFNDILHHLVCVVKNIFTENKNCHLSFLFTNDKKDQIIVKRSFHSIFIINIWNIMRYVAVHSVPPQSCENLQIIKRFFDRMGPDQERTWYLYLWRLTTIQMSLSDKDIVKAKVGILFSWPLMRKLMF